MTPSKAAGITAFINQRTLKDNPEIGCQIIQDAAEMTGVPISNVTHKDGEYYAVVKCGCGQKNRVQLTGMGDWYPVCARCKESL